jgi:hypothetical protein
MTAERRRIDVVIETPKAMLGIENKPWAGQQPNQLDAYYKDIEARSGGRRFGLLFLSDQEEQSAKGKAIKLPYADQDDDSLFRVLSSTLADIKAPKTREFVSDFLSWIDVRFGGGTVPESFKRVYIDAIEAHFDASSVNRKAVAAVMLARTHLCNRSLDAIGKHITQKLQEHFDDITFGAEESLANQLRQKWTPWLVRRKGWPDHCDLAIEADQNGSRSIVYGVRALDPKSNEGRKWSSYTCAARQKLDGLTLEIANGGKTAWWPWREFAVEANWTDEFAARLLIESDGEIESHPYVQGLAEKMVALAQAVSRLV